MYDVIALGALLIDFAPRGVDDAGYPTMAANPGGAPCNFLAALNACGGKTAFIGKVGDDAFGHLLKGTLTDAGIDTKGLVVDPEVFTTLAFVTLDERGDRSFSFARKPGADTQLRWEEVDRAMIDEARVFHFGTLSLTDEPARTATQKAVAYAKSRGKLITCDPNLRRPLWKTEAAAREQILWSLGQADVVKISDEEVEFLWNCTPEEGADLGHLGLVRLHGELPHPIFGQGNALIHQRTRKAVGIAGHALQGAKLHRRLVILSCMCRRKQCLGHRGDELLATGRIDRFIDAKYARPHTAYVAINCCLGNIKGKRGYGSCCVIAHATERADAVIGGRKTAHRHHLLSRSMQVARPRIVSQALP